jgi:DNA polymerase
MSDLAAHLRFLAELGIDGVSLDPVWTTRRDAGAPAVEAAPPGSSTAHQAPGTEHQVLVPHQAPSTKPQAPVMDPVVVLEAIRVEIGPDCSRCKLHRLGRSKVVFGVGNPRARVMFVGEGPGADEDAQGIPFVGRAGQLLTDIIKAMGLTRDDVYIANVVKCRPPNNRAPEPDEVATCGPFLLRQIDAIGPEVIVALGASAAQALLGTRDPISRLRGQVLQFRGARLIPTFHPAYLLRSPDRKRDVWEDVQKAMAILGLERPTRKP